MPGASSGSHSVGHSVGASDDATEAAEPWRRTAGGQLAAALPADLAVSGVAPVPLLGAGDEASDAMYRTETRNRSKVLEAENGRYDC